MARSFFTINIVVVLIENVKLKIIEIIKNWKVQGHPLLINVVENVKTENCEEKTENIKVQGHPSLIDVVVETTENIKTKKQGKTENLKTENRKKNWKHKSGRPFLTNWCCCRHKWDPQMVNDVRSVTMTKTVTQITKKNWVSQKFFFLVMCA